MYWFIFGSREYLRTDIIHVTVVSYIWFYLVVTGCRNIIINVRNVRRCEKWALSLISECKNHKLESFILHEAINWTAMGSPTCWRISIFACEILLLRITLKCSFYAPKASKSIFLAQSIAFSYCCLPYRVKVILIQSVTLVF